MVFNRLFSGFRKVPATTRAQATSAAQMQDAIVRSIVDDHINLHDFEWEDREWVYIAVNHELLIEDGRRSSTQTAVLAHKPGGGLEDLSFRLSLTSKQKLIALQEAMRQVDEKPWSSSPPSLSLQPLSSGSDQRVLSLAHHRESTLV